MTDDNGAPVVDPGVPDPSGGVSAGDGGDVADSALEGTAETEDPGTLNPSERWHRQDKEFKASLKKLNGEIQELSKAPFRQILAEMLGCKPDIESLQAFANKMPDRWAQSVAIMAKNAGYDQKHTVEHNHNILIAQMSDAQLFHELRKTEKALEKLIFSGQTLIEHDPPQTTS